MIHCRIQPKILTEDATPIGTATMLSCEITYKAMNDTEADAFYVLSSINADDNRTWKTLRERNAVVPITGWKQDDSKLVKNLCDAIGVELIEIVTDLTTL